MMNDLAVRPEINLPSTFEDLSRFVLEDVRSSLQYAQKLERLIKSD